MAPETPSTSKSSAATMTDSASGSGSGSNSGGASGDRTSSPLAVEAASLALQRSLRSKTNEAIRVGAVVKACDRCRRRQQKCDGERPVCGRCGKANTDCSWAAVVLKPGKPNRKEMQAFKSANVPYVTFRERVRRRKGESASHRRTNSASSAHQGGSLLSDVLHGSFQEDSPLVRTQSLHPFRSDDPFDDARSISTTTSTAKDMDQDSPHMPGVLLPQHASIRLGPAAPSNFAFGYEPQPHPHWYASPAGLSHQYHHHIFQPQHMPSSSPAPGSSPLAQASMFAPITPSVLAAAPPQRIPVSPTICQWIPDEELTSIFPHPDPFAGKLHVKLGTSLLFAPASGQSGVLFLDEARELQMTDPELFPTSCADVHMANWTIIGPKGVTIGPPWEAMQKHGVHSDSLVGPWLDLTAAQIAEEDYAALIEEAKKLLLHPAALHLIKRYFTTLHHLYPARNAVGAWQQYAAMQQFAQTQRSPWNPLTTRQILASLLTMVASGSILDVGGTVQMPSGQRARINTWRYGFRCNQVGYALMQPKSGFFPREEMSFWFLQAEFHLYMPWLAHPLWNNLLALAGKSHAVTDRDEATLQSLEPAQLEEARRILAQYRGGIISYRVWFDLHTPHVKWIETPGLDKMSGSMPGEFYDEGQGGATSRECLRLAFERYQIYRLFEKIIDSGLLQASTPEPEMRQNNSRTMPTVAVAAAAASARDGQPKPNAAISTATPTRSPSSNSAALGIEEKEQLAAEMFEELQTWARRVRDGRLSIQPVNAWTRLEQINARAGRKRLEALYLNALEMIAAVVPHPDARIGERSPIDPAVNEEEEDEQTNDVDSISQWIQTTDFFRPDHLANDRK